MATAEARAASPQARAAEALEQEQLGRWDAAARLYALSFRAAVLEGDVAQAADALRGQARVLIQEERFEEAAELVELSREIAERSGLVQAAARAINVLGIIRYRQRDWAAAGEQYRRALELALDVGDDDLAGLAVQNAGVIAYVRGDLREARSLYLESIGAFVRSGNSANAVMAYNNLGIACADLREWLEAEIYYTRGIELAERQSQSALLAKLYGNRAEPLIEIGDFDQAAETLAGAEVAATAVGDRVALGVVWRWRAALARLRKDFGEAERCVERALSFATDPTLERAEILLELGDQHAQQGRIADAEAAYLRSRELSQSLAAAAQLREADTRIEILREGSAEQAVARG
jgi:tetratricopeptide (TPR) repeat protein